MSTEIQQRRCRATQRAQTMTSQRIKKTIVRARVTPAMNDALNDVTAHTGESTSEIIRAALTVELTSRGLWPPKCTAESATK